MLFDLDRAYREFDRSVRFGKTDWVNPNLLYRCYNKSVARNLIMGYPGCRDAERKIRTAVGAKNQLEAEKRFMDAWEEAFRQVKEIANPGQVKALQQALDEKRDEFAIYKRVLENEIREGK